MSTSESRTVGAVVGLNVRRLRESLGWTQQELAVRLRASGLDWSRHQVAAIELGRRDGVELSELVILLLVLEVSGGVGQLLCPPEGLPSADVQLTADVAMSCQHATLLLAGGTENDLSKVRSKLSDAAGATYMALMVGGLRADERLAERLDIEVEDVLAAADRLWGHSLTEERDRRVSELGGEAGDRRARRGHITRQLSAEIEHEIANKENNP